MYVYVKILPPIVDVYGLYLNKIILQVVNAPRSARSLVKSTICPKEKFPYGVNKFEMFYKPNCIEKILKCKDICGKKCKKQCTPKHDGCARGKLSSNFMHCPMKPNSSDELAYVKYELAAEKTVKEGKQPYKKMEKTMSDLPVQEFINRFIAEFPAYSQHEVESWFLNVVKNAALSNGYMPSHVISQVTDFAQNLVMEKRHAISEEYFHKAQVALAATVTKVSTPIRNEEGSNESQKSVEHLLSQITSSDNK